jgi:hypothetical protein
MSYDMVHTECGFVAARWLYHPQLSSDDMLEIHTALAVVHPGEAKHQLIEYKVKLGRSCTLT